MKDELKATVGKKLRKIRKSLGFTQEKMVTYFDIGRANYSRIEKGEVSPGLTLLKTLGDKFDVSLDWLVNNSGSMFMRDADQSGHKESAAKELQHAGECAKELALLYTYIEKVPVVKHAMLCFFLEYLHIHQEMIDEYLKRNEPPEEDIPATDNNA